MSESDNGNRAPRRLNRPVPREGEDGLFTQSWFPICYSHELEPGQVLGKDFLDGRVVAYRGANGKAVVASAYCPHLGVDLAHGKVVENNIQCAFHLWEYDQNGQCVKTGIGDPPPKNACLFRFPTVEKYGVVFAFNGEQAAWEIPDLELGENEVIQMAAPSVMVNCDPWVMIANTPDIQHFHLLHGFNMDVAAARDTAEWHDNGMRYTMLIESQGNRYRFQPNVLGTGVFFVNGELLSGPLAGKRFGLMAPFGLRAPGQTEIFTVVMVEKGDGGEQAQREAEQVFGQLHQQFGNMVAEDLPLVNDSHFLPGTLTQIDSELAKYLQLVRRYPRAHPSRDFIN